VFRFAVRADGGLPESWLRVFVDASPMRRWQATVSIFSSTPVIALISGWRHFGSCRPVPHAKSTAGSFLTLRKTGKGVGVLGWAPRRRATPRRSRRVSHL